MRVLVSVDLLGKIRHVAEEIDDPAWQQSPTFHAYVTLAEIERRLGDEGASESWFARLAEIEPAADGEL